MHLVHGADLVNVLYVVDEDVVGVILLFFYMIDLNVDSLVVRNTSNDTLVVYAAVQWVAMRAVVGILAIGTTVMVKGVAVVQAVDCGILLAVREEHQQMEFHTLCVTLRY